MNTRTYKPTLQESHYEANGLQKRIMMVGALAMAGMIAFSAANVLRQALAHLIAV